MDFLVLGPLQVREGGRAVPLGSGKERSLLGLLLLHANEPVSVERLVDGLWGPRPPASAVKLVQGYVSSLRRRLGPDRLLTRPPGYAIRVEEGELDAFRFEELVSHAGEAAPEEAARRLRAALALWRGPPLTNVRIEDAAETGVELLSEQWLAARIERIDADLLLGRHAALIGELDALATEHPLAERVRAQLMLALYRSGRQADALEVYRDARRTLAEEVGIDPSPELKALERRILNQDPSLDLEPQPGPPQEALDLPPPLRADSPFPFVGRVRELAALRELLPRAPADGRRIALVGGEAGSGKTRLVREFAREAAADGALVLYGACDPVVRTPYRPVVQALAPLVAPEGPLGSKRDWQLRQLLPELPPTLDPDTERQLLQTAIADLLEEAGRRRPVLLVLEDGHWADTPTLLLLRYLARAAADARVLVLATFRDTEAEVPAQLADALVDLRRADDAVRLHLAGLGPEDVADFLAVSAPRSVAHSELAVALSELTGGNAFLLCELWRTLIESEAVEVEGGRLRLRRPLEQIAPSQSVRDVVNRRLAGLPHETRDLLELAAVIGPEVELELLRRVAPDALAGLDALEPAERAGMIGPVPPGLAYRFTHELVRRALYDGLASVRRAALHLRIAEALEQSGHADSDRGIADLAHHFAAAATLGGRDRAVDYNLRAARLAMASFAFTEAAARFEVALAIGVSDERRAEVLLELGAASFRAGELPRALESYREAAQTAREGGHPELLAAAGLGLENAYRRGLIVGEEVVELLEEASEAVGAGDSPLRVRLLAALARALSLRGDAARGGLVRESAVGMARRLGDRHGLALALMNAFWARGSTPLEEIAEMMVEACDLAGEIGELELQAEAMLLSVTMRSTLGDIAAARDWQARALETARRLRQPFVLHAAEQHGSALALLEGRLADAEAAAESAREWGAMLTGPPAHAAYGIQMFGIRREQGRLRELAPGAQALAAEDLGASVWRPAFAALLAELGLDERVERELASVRREGLDRLRPGLWVASLAYLTDACGAVGNRETAALVYPELAAYEGRNIVVGYSVAYYGAADRYLGILAATLGDFERAERHFASARALNGQMGAKTWLAHGCYEHGRLLLASGEAARAAPLVAEAAALAEDVGMPALLGRIRALSVPPVPVHPGQHGLSEREADVLRLVARGRSNREIGAALCISEHTVANHVRSILRKTGTANRTDATAYAHRHGLVEVQHSK